MANFDLIRRLVTDEGGRIIMLVLDGVGGLPMTPDGQTELEAASTPNLDRLAGISSLGLSIPVARGITTGSGPGHLALFGYDPLVYDIGRGVLEALGLGLEVNDGDVAVRGNFCTLDSTGNISDRRAGRISTEEGEKRVALLQDIQIEGVKTTLRAGEGYRFALVLRGEGLSPELSDTDPQATGVPPLPAVAEKPEADRTARLVNEWVIEATRRLADHAPANGLTLRGFAGDPALPKYPDIYKLQAACVAVYPMYKGVSQLVGMDIIETDISFTPQEEFDKVAEIYKQYEFIFCHVKYTDSRGEDGDFDAKARVIESVDAALPTLLNLNPDVLIITGDHSTPAKMRSHSWHPVPTMIYAPATAMPDCAPSFGERQCRTGSLGQFPAKDLMQFALAHAQRLQKFGA